MGGRVDPGDHPDETRLASPVGVLGTHDPLEPVDVVEVVHHDESDTVAHGQLEFLVGLGVAVQDQS
jgi:hypothetical protein